LTPISKKEFKIMKKENNDRLLDEKINRSRMRSVMTRDMEMRIKTIAELPRLLRKIRSSADEGRKNKKEA